MFSKQVFRRCLMPMAVAAVAVETKGKNVSNNQPEQTLCRPSELPLYTPEPTSHTHTIEEQHLPSKLEEAIKTARLKLSEFNTEVNAYKRVGVEQFEKRKEELDWVVNYLRQEDNTLPKVGAIGIGAITGLIFGLRGGFFKKTLYMTTGALGMTSLCYPKEASEYTQVGLAETKKYAIVAYNFVNGEGKNESKNEAEEQVIENRTEIKEVTVEDPLLIITRSRDEAVSKNCHCPIGACMGHD